MSCPASNDDLEVIQDRELPTLLEPHGYHASTCGYCSPVGQRSIAETSKSFGMTAKQMSPRIYQTLIDRGWRRSGDYVYHPDMANTCCPQYTIRLCCSRASYAQQAQSSSASTSPSEPSVSSSNRLQITAFDAGKDKKLRKIMNRWKRYIVEGVKPVAEGEEKGEGSSAVGSAPSKSDGVGESPKGSVKGNHLKDAIKRKGNEDPDSNPLPDRTPLDITPRLTSGEQKKAKNAPWVKGKASATKGKQEASDYVKEIHASERKHAGPTAVDLVPAKATEEAFDLYDRYQQAIHGDQVGKNSSRSFDRFLCYNPLGKQRIPYPVATGSSEGLPSHYGCYHQQWRLDRKLIAFSVLDILPGCVSSVYFVWDPDFAWASLGKLSAIREAALAREFAEAGMITMGWLYMGYYIHSCQKMRYKGEYEPSFVLDPGTNAFHGLASVRDLLDNHPTGYQPFSRAEEGPSVPVRSPSRLKSAFTPPRKSRKITAAWPSPAPPSFLDPKTLAKSAIGSLATFMDGSLVPLKHIRFIHPAMVHALVAELLAAVGVDMLATADTIDRGVFLTFG